MKKSLLGLLGVMVATSIGLFVGSSEANAWDIKYECWNDKGYTLAYDNGVAGYAKAWSTMTGFKMQTWFPGLNIQYRVHYQTYGWSGWVNEGTKLEANGKRIEAINFRHSGSLHNSFTLRATPHLQTHGWLGSTDTNRYGYNMIGTTGEYRRLEAIKLRLLWTPYNPLG